LHHGNPHIKKINNGMVEEKKEHKNGSFCKIDDNMQVCKRYACVTGFVAKK
jgi:hypothetical protein